LVGSNSSEMKSIVMNRIMLRIFTTGGRNVSIKNPKYAVIKG